MKRRRWLIVLVVGVLAVGGLWFVLTQVSLSALEGPGRVETYLATQAKRWLVGRRAGGELAVRPANNDLSVAMGRMQYGARCASCHGQDGRTPTDVGLAQYPPTPALDSPEVQQWSDAELFWIIKHGIRLTGMPAFGNIHTDDEVWHLVHYVRSLGRAPEN